jgi:CheY-like chemotaxis protein/transcriptional regulator with XRE-family HTH domain
VADKPLFPASAELFGLIREVVDIRRRSDGRSSDAEIGRVVGLESARTSRWKHGQMEISDADRLIALSQAFDIDLTVLCHVAAGQLSAGAAAELISSDRELVRFLGEQLVLPAERRKVTLTSGEGAEARIVKHADGGYERTFRRRGSGVVPAPEQEPVVLLVDDDPQTLTLFANLGGSRAGIKGITARSGPQALVLAGECHPRLVIFDLFVGGVDGLAAVRSMAAGRPSSGPVVVATSLHVSPELERAALGNGAAELLQRPLRSRTLGKLLRSVRGA